MTIVSESIIDFLWITVTCTPLAQGDPTHVTNTTNPDGEHSTALLSFFLSVIISLF